MRARRTKAALLRRSLAPFVVASLTAAGLMSAPAAKAIDPPPNVATLAWGLNDYGQLGTSTGPRGWETPGPISALPSDVVTLSAGFGHALALTSSGEVWSWGRGQEGELGDGTLSSRPTPQRVPALNDVVAIEAGGANSFAVKADGSIFAWGNNNYGQLGDGTTIGPRPVPGPVAAPPGTRFKSVAFDPLHALGLTTDGAVLAWGHNGSGQLGDGTTTSQSRPQPVPGLESGVQQIAVGFHHSVALKADGTVWAWGRNGEGQLGRGHTESGADVLRPKAVVDLSGVKTIAASNTYTLAVRADGSVLRWGYGPIRDLGVPGYPPDGPDSRPVAVAGLAGVTELAAGREHSLARKSDGSLWAWGRHQFEYGGLGVLGTGGGEPLAAPAQVVDMDGGVSAIAAGSSFNLVARPPETAAPTRPSAPTVSARAGEGKAKVSWHWPPPVDVGRRPITSYQIKAFAADGSEVGSQTTTATILNTDFTGLTNGQPYTFSVSATNEVGTGPPSARSTPVVPGTAVERLWPTSGPEGTRVIVEGSGFTGVSKVMFGDVEASFTTYGADFQFAAVAPVHAAGPVDVVVTSPTGTSAVHPAARFTYDPAKVIQLEPSTGPSRGGTSVVITGKSFVDVKAVHFGDLPATFFRTDSVTQITAGSPAQTPDGPVQVVVTTGTGPAVAASPTADKYLYLDGDWSPAGTLTRPRVQHTATLLKGSHCAPRCGRVLLAGGSSRNGSVETSEKGAELYDRTTDLWSDTGAMKVPRFGHTATLLGDGKVLVAGGLSKAEPAQGYTYSGRTPLASSELYDPATGTWTETAGAMGTAREMHAASLLPDGRVLVTGGNCFTPEVSVMGLIESACTREQALSSAEIYDPASDTWSNGPPMAYPRENHSSTVLEDGTVLVAGGEGYGPPATGSTSTISNPSSMSAEIFAAGAAGGTWRVTGSMNGPHAKHTATLLQPSGSIAIAKVLVVGGSGVPELYDPTANGRDKQGNTVVGGWTPTPPIPRSSGATTSPFHEGHTATLLEQGQVLVAGGRAENVGLALADVRVYLPATNLWFSVDSLAHPRQQAVAVTLPSSAAGGSALLMTGGTGTDVDPVAPSSAELFDITPNRPPTIFSIEPPAGRSSRQTRLTITGVGLFPDAVVKIDGRQAPILEETYKRLVVMVPGRPQGVVDVVVNTPNGSSRAGRFTYGAGAWVPTGSFKGVTQLSTPQGTRESSKRFQHGAVLLDPPICHTASPPTDYPCGKVMVVGGADDNQHGYSHALVELYDPASGTWATTTPMAGGTRFDFTATLLADGRVLVAGGRQPDANLPNRSTAEVYDPRTGQWTPTDNEMSVGRQSHSASLLDDGRVLVAGGVTNEVKREGLTSVDLYDPATNRWSPAPPMNEGRQLHTATLLPNGDVVVTGGFTETDSLVFVALTSAEVFRVTPGTPGGSWISTSPLAAARFGHSATLLDKVPCGESCGKVLVAGGYVSDGNVVGLASAEIFDPATGTFAPAGLPNTPRGGHSATLLDDGKVLLAGRAYPVTGSGFHPAVAHAELFDPVAGRWSHTDGMGAQRGQHTATLLDGPACRAESPPAYCHSVLVAGGGGSGDLTLPGLDTAELYRPVPRVQALLPSGGSRLGGTEVAITGSGFEPTSTVTFGDTPAASVVFESTTLLRAVTPPHARGKVEVAVTNASGTSGHIVPRLDAPFTYQTTSVPDQVMSLVATATSSSDITLTFAAPADDQQFPQDSPPAERYVVKQSQVPFTDAASFASALSLCPVGGCPFVPPGVGSELSLEVHHLEAATTYYYAVAALNDVGQGPVSVPASGTTHPAPPLPLPSGCAAPPALEPGQITYPALRYSLVGLPEGTQVTADSSLYSWLDVGAGGKYSVTSAPARAGHGYWAWFKCPKVINLRPGKADVSLPLGEYHASMVGNPSTRPATVTGHDFAARWDPSLNAGAGGYRISGYREPQPLDVGEGTWVFSYVRTTVRIGS